MESNHKSSCMFLYYKNALSPPPFPILLIFKTKRVISVRGQWHICNCQVTFYEWKAFSAQFSFSLQMDDRARPWLKEEKYVQTLWCQLRPFFWARCGGRGEEPAICEQQNSSDHDEAEFQIIETITKLLDTPPLSPRPLPQSSSYTETE